MKEKWVIAAKKADFKGLGEKLGVDQVIVRILRNRGLITLPEMQTYLYGGRESLHNPHLLKDADKAASLLLQAIASGKKIRIIGDYDIDGIQSTYILLSALRRLGADADTVIPDRVRDGYGLNEHLVTQAQEDGVDLILTCDNGISAISQIAKAKELGMTVIVTDHHEVPFEDVPVSYGAKTANTVRQEAGAGSGEWDERGAAVPRETSAASAAATAPQGAQAASGSMTSRGAQAAPREGVRLIRRQIRSAADAVVNPKQDDCPYPFKGLCGAAVAWKLIQVLYEQAHLPETAADCFIENVGFATVGDVMELQGENRVLVKLGLEALRKTTNPGMRALILQKKLQPENVKSWHIGFTLGPCLNAAGRLDTARRALELLLCEDPARASVLAAQLVELNESRKLLTARAVEQAREQVAEKKYDQDKVIVLFLPDCHESLAGIVAGRIREATYRPTFVITRGEEGAKGSARSIEAYSMYEEMCKCRSLFTKFGGHPMAAGFSLREENIGELRRQLNEKAELTEDDLTPKVVIDVPMPVDYITEGLVHQLEMLEPFGKGNEKPVFADRRPLVIQSLGLLGAERNVIRMRLASPTGCVLDAVCFGKTEDLRLSLEEKYGKVVADETLKGNCATRPSLTFLYYPEIDHYYAQPRLQLKITGFSA